MKIEKTWFINNLDIFRGIPPEEIMKIAQCVRDETFDSKYTLYIPGESVENIYLIKNGEVLFYHLRNGKRVIYDTLGPGDLFGNFSKKPTTVKHFAAVSPGTRICTFPVDDFLKIVQKYPEVMLQTIQLLSDRLQEYESRISLCSATAKEKILEELLRYREKQKRALFGVVRNDIKITHQKLAHLTGLNRVTVTRGLQELAKSKVIDIKKGGRITLRDL